MFLIVKHLTVAQTAASKIVLQLDQHLRVYSDYTEPGMNE